MGIEQWLAQFTQVLHPVNLVILSFAEAIFLPIPPDVMLIPMVVVEPDRALFFAMLATIASVVGAAVGYTVGLKGGRPLLRRFAKGPTVERIETMFHQYGFWAIVVAGFLPVPYKLVSITSGVLGFDWRRLLAASLLLRGARFIIVALVVRTYGAALAETIARSSGWYTAIFFGALALVLVVWWRRRAKLEVKPETDV